MRLAAVGDEKNLGRIVARVYGDLSPADLKHAREALLRENPQLRSIRDVPPGTMIVVPDIGRRPSRASHADQSYLDVVTHVADALAEYRDRLAASAEAEANDAKSGAGALKSREIKALLSEFPELREHAATVADVTEQRLAMATSVRRLAQTELDTLAKDLSTLIDRVR